MQYGTRDQISWPTVDVLDPVIGPHPVLVACH